MFLFKKNMNVLNKMNLHYYLLLFYCDKVR